MGKAKATEEQRQAAVAAVRKGKSRAEIAKQYKVSLPTIHLWMAHARNPVTTSELKGDDLRIAQLNARLDQIERRFDRLEGQIEILVRMAGKK